MADVLEATSTPDSEESEAETEDWDEDEPTDDEGSGPRLLGAVRRGPVPQRNEGPVDVESEPVPAADWTGWLAAASPQDLIRAWAARAAREQAVDAEFTAAPSDDPVESNAAPEPEAVEPAAYEPHGGPFVTDTVSTPWVAEPWAGTYQADSGTVAAAPAAGDSDARSRPETPDTYPDAIPADAGRGAPTREWPTVSEILAAQGMRRDAGSRAPGRPMASRGEARRASRYPTPTSPEAPGQWSLPLWLAWVPAATVAAGLGTAAVGAGWLWAGDSYRAGLVASRLEAGEAAKPLPEGVEPGPPTWWGTTSHHLAQWAAYLDRGADDPAKAERSVELLHQAAAVSPIQPTARYALAHPMPGEPERPSLARSLGQTRDVVALTWSGRQLLAAGKRDAALRAYRAALEMAARSDPSRAVAPPFLDDAPTRRYALPSEDLLAPVVRDMIAQTGWTYKDWAPAVPAGTTAPVVVARVLREQGSADADPALDAALADTEALPEGPGAASALRIAARAEALAMKGRWAEAGDLYTQAIDQMPADVVRRAWWINVADLALRLNEESKRMRALESAKNSDLKDEVTQRAVALQRAAGVGGERTEIQTARAPAPRS